MRNNIFNKFLFFVFGFSIWMISFIFGWYSYRSTDFYIAYWDILNTETLKDYNELYEYINSYDKNKK